GRTGDALVRVFFYGGDARRRRRDRLRFADDEPSAVRSTIDHFQGSLPVNDDIARAVEGPEPIGCGGVGTLIGDSKRLGRRIEQNDYLAIDPTCNAGDRVGSRWPRQTDEGPSSDINIVI